MFTGTICFGTDLNTIRTDANPIESVQQKTVSSATLESSESVGSALWRRFHGLPFAMFLFELHVKA